MKIIHYITLDKGSGPVSLVEVQLSGAVHMIRITHNARFERVKEVDPVSARTAVDNAPDLGQATARVKPEHAHTLAQEILRWTSQHGNTDQALRWGEDGVALLFKTETDALSWDSSHAEELRADTAPAPRRRIVG